jgi:DNA-binding transcriptional regulator YiaG
MNTILATPLADANGYKEDFVQAASVQRELSTRLASIVERASKDESVPWDKTVQFIIEALNISPEQLRLIAKVSLSTISRWRSGDAEPHMMMRAYIGAAVAEHLRAQRNP